MHFDTHAIHEPRVLHRRVKKHRKKFKGKEKAKTAETVPVPKQIKVICGGSLVSSLTTTSSEAADLCALTKERFDEDIEEHGGPFKDDDDKMTIVVVKKPCSISITNCDLLKIVNGKATDPIELWPFD